MAAKALAERRVLITRPRGRADELLAALRQQGVPCWHLPLLSIAALADDEPQLLQCRQRIADLDNYHYLIFISVNAVENGLREIDRFWPQWPQGVTALAIGAATEKALRESPLPVAAGLSIAESPQGSAMTSEALLGNAPLQDLSHGRILIFRGLGGRETLAEVLRQRGARVDYAECYRRSEAPLEPDELKQLILSNDINTVCVNSGETLSTFARQLKQEPLVNRLQLIVPSARVAELASEQGFKHIVVSDNAGTAATLRALEINSLPN